MNVGSSLYLRFDIVKFQSAGDKLRFLELSFVEHLRCLTISKTVNVGPT